MGMLTAFFERRASLENPATSLSNPDAWLWDAFGASQASSGARVSETTALQSVAVYACVRVLANTIASLPWVTYERLAQGKQRATAYPLYGLLHDRPNPEMSSFNFRECLQGHLMLWGNAYAEIERNHDGSVRALWPLLPNATRPKRRPTGEKYYETQVAGRTYELPADLVLHIPGLGFDGQVGYSPIRLHREAIGLSLAAEEFGARFFGAGSRPSGVLSHPGKLSSDAKSRLSEGWTKAYGGLSNSHRTAILEEGVTWQALGIPPDDAQFLETRKFQVSEVARMFGVPPHMLADLERATFSNIEHQSIEYVMHSVRPVAVRWEQPVNWQLIPARDRATYVTEFSVEGLLRGDSTQRAAFYQQLFQVGALSVNDIREKENLNPVEGGDQRFVPLNMVPLDMARAVAEKPKPAPAFGARSEARGVRADALLPLCREVCERMLKRELVQLRRAAKRGSEELVAWAEEFYASHQGVIAQAYAPAIESVAGVFLPPAVANRFAQNWSLECAMRQVLLAREDLTSLAGATRAAFDLRAFDLAQRWENDRAATTALADARRLAEALQEECAVMGGAASDSHSSGASASQHLLDAMGDLRTATVASLTRETPAPVITVQTAPVHVDVTMPAATGAHRTVTHWTRNERGEITQTISERVPDEAAA